MKIVIDERRANEIVPDFGANLRRYFVAPVKEISIAWNRDLQNAQASFQSEDRQAMGKTKSSFSPDLMWSVQATDGVRIYSVNRYGEMPIEIASFYVDRMFETSEGFETFTKLSVDEKTRLRETMLTSMMARLQDDVAAESSASAPAFG